MRCCWEGRARADDGRAAAVDDYAVHVHTLYREEKTRIQPHSQVAQVGRIHHGRAAIIKDTYTHTDYRMFICVPMIVVRFLDVFLLLMANNRNEGRKKERNAIASAVQCFFIPFFLFFLQVERRGRARVIYDSRTNAQQPRERPCGFARDVKKKKRMCRCISLSLSRLLQCCVLLFLPILNSDANESRTTLQHRQVRFESGRCCVVYVCDHVGRTRKREERKSFFFLHSDAARVK